MSTCTNWKEPYHNTCTILENFVIKDEVVFYNSTSYINKLNVAQQRKTRFAQSHTTLSKGNRSACSFFTTLNLTTQKNNNRLTLFHVEHTT